MFKSKKNKIIFENKKLNTPKKENVYPLRINHYLALKDYCSRREADLFIEKGLVRINGKVARLGDRVFESDIVVFDQKSKPKEYKYFLYNKPVGVVSSPEQDQKKIIQSGGFSSDLFPVGRLDKESHGIIVVTNDGRVTTKLLDPKYDHQKEYKVTVDKDIKNLDLKKMSESMKLENFKTKTSIVKRINKKTFLITLTEGKKHQIRRMCAALGYQVRDLERIRIMTLEKRDLKQGQKREIVGTELEKFLKSIGLVFDL